MLIKLQRRLQNKISTVGELSINGTPFFHVLEDGWHVAKLPGITRIPAGTYPIKLRTEGGLHAKYLQRFGPEFHKGMLWLIDVPDYEYVYFHCGNKVEHTKGCLLNGSEIVAPADPEGAYEVHGSEKAYREFYPPVAATLLATPKESVWISIVDPK